MSEDKKINPADLPKKVTRTTTQQPEEYIDQGNLEKSEDAIPRPPASDSGDYRHGQGNQETN